MNVTPGHRPDPASLDQLLTEQHRPDLADLDRRGTAELVTLMIDDHAGVIDAIRAAAGDIEAAIDAVVRQLERGGRLVYVGAGTAGRMGVLDAAECPPTFNTDRVIGVMAGGSGAVKGAREGSEDDAGAGAAEIEQLDVGPNDIVVGIAASGRTPYTVGAVRRAREAGAVTVAISSNPAAELSAFVDHPIEVSTGPEFLAGSTRLKAGTAQKIVLNVISTIGMIRLGKAFGNLMVDVRASNFKLRERAKRMVVQATGAAQEDVDRAIEQADGDVKTAIVMLLTGSDAATANRRLELADGVVRKAVDQS